MARYVSPVKSNVWKVSLRSVNSMETKMELKGGKNISSDLEEVIHFMLPVFGKSNHLLVKISNNLRIKICLRKD